MFGVWILPLRSKAGADAFNVLDKVSSGEKSALVQRVWKSEGLNHGIQD